MSLEQNGMKLYPIGASSAPPRELFIGLDSNGQERALFCLLAVLCLACFAKAVQFGFYREHYNEAKVGGGDGRRAAARIVTT